MPVNPLGDVDFYSLDLLAGDVATFVVVGEGGLPGGSSLAPELEIFDDAGTSLAFDDGEPLIRFTAPASGTYFASVRDTTSQSPAFDGDYQLLVTCGSCAPAPAPGCFVMQKASLAIQEKKPGNEKLKLALKKPAQPLPDGALGSCVICS